MLRGSKRRPWSPELLWDKIERGASDPSSYHGHIVFILICISVPLKFLDMDGAALTKFHYN